VTDRDRPAANDVIAPDAILTEAVRRALRRHESSGADPHRPAADHVGVAERGIDLADPNKLLSELVYDLRHPTRRF
jgi:hypothetical protein